MRLTHDIELNSILITKVPAAQCGIRLGTVVNDANQSPFAPLDNPSDKIGVSHAGFPVLTLGRTIISEEVAAFEGE